VGIRSGAPDYLPYVGPLPDVGAFERDYGQRLRKGQLRDDFPSAVWHSGIYCSLAHGSRGITSALLAAEILGGYVSGHGLPVERDVLDAIHPARALIRAWRRRQA
jgi:tRNA 5-methylaminomethyl-2-thiouridine biosynthesis bifunctional protein